MFPSVQNCLGPLRGIDGIGRRLVRRHQDLEVCGYRFIKALVIRLVLSRSWISVKVLPVARRTADVTKSVHLNRP